MNVCFSSLLKSGSFSDFSLHVNGKQIKLHRAIIAERSQYFAKIFEKDPTARFCELTIPDNCFEIIDSVFNWLYSDPNFHVTKQTFGPIIRLAVTLQIPTLLTALLQWMSSNITADNTMFFYFTICDIQDKLDPEFMKIIINRIVIHFELLDKKDVSSLPYSIFYQCITDPEFLSSSYRLSSSISNFLSTNKKITKEERNQLINLYIKTDWPVDISEIISAIGQNESQILLELVAKHFKRLNDTELAKIPNAFLSQLIARDDLNVPNADYVRERVQSLTSSMTRVNKQANLRLWQAFTRNGEKRTFHSIPITISNLRVLILASVYLDVLLDIKTTLIKGGILPQNIVVFDADVKKPKDSFLFQFDVIFTFTHYQFYDSESMSESLVDFVKNGGGLVTCYGFCRGDEWGCGDENLMQYLPIARGPIIPHIHEGKLIIHDNSSPLIQGITEIKQGGFSPRSSVSLLEGAHLIASYADEIPLVAYKNIDGQSSRVVSINFYPITSRIHRLGYNPEQPWDKIFSRSVLYAAGLEPKD